MYILVVVFVTGKSFLHYRVFKLVLLLYISLFSVSFLSLFHTSIHPSLNSSILFFLDRQTSRHVDRNIQAMCLDRNKMFTVLHKHYEIF